MLSRNQERHSEIVARFEGDDPKKKIEESAKRNDFISEIYKFFFNWCRPNLLSGWGRLQNGGAKADTEGVNSESDIALFNDVAGSLIKYRSLIMWTHVIPLIWKECEKLKDFLKGDCFFIITHIESGIQYGG